MSCWDQANDGALTTEDGCKGAVIADARLTSMYVTGSKCATRRQRNLCAVQGKNGVARGVASALGILLQAVCSRSPLSSVVCPDGDGEGVGDGFGEGLGEGEGEGEGDGLGCLEGDGEGFSSPPVPEVVTLGSTLAANSSSYT